VDRALAQRQDQRERRGQRIRHTEVPHGLAGTAPVDELPDTSHEKSQGEYRVWR
jgi:hypothetical protein